MCSRDAMNCVAWPRRRFTKDNLTFSGVVRSVVAPVEECGVVKKEGEESGIYPGFRTDGQAGT